MRTDESPATLRTLLSQLRLMVVLLMLVKHLTRVALSHHRMRRLRSKLLITVYANERALEPAG